MPLGLTHLACSVTSPVHNLGVTWPEVESVRARLCACPRRGVASTFLFRRRPWAFPWSPLSPPPAVVALIIVEFRPVRPLPRAPPLSPTSLTGLRLPPPAAPRPRTLSRGSAPRQPLSPRYPPASCFRGGCWRSWLRHGIAGGLRLGRSRLVGFELWPRHGGVLCGRDCRPCVRARLAIHPGGTCLVPDGCSR